MQLEENVIIMRNYCLYDASLCTKTHSRLTNEVNDRIRQVFSQKFRSLRGQLGHPEMNKYGKLWDPRMRSFIIIHLRFNNRWDWSQT